MVQFAEKQNLNEKLESEIRRKNVSLQKATVEEMAQNIIDVYDTDLEEANKAFFSVPNNRIADIIEYVKFCGGYELFDFIV